MKYIKVLGLMSGTSMDGLDCGLFDISLSHNYKLVWKCHGFNTFAYSERFRTMIRKSIEGKTGVIKDANEQLGKVFLSSTRQFLENRKVDMIASHGQTIAHNNGISTTQIGNPQYLFDEYGVPYW